MGKEADAFVRAKVNVDAWHRELEQHGLDAVVINASGCGTTVKDYGFMLRSEPEWAEKAAAVSALAKDITEVMRDLGMKPSGQAKSLSVAYHRSEERRVGKECVRTCRSRWSPYH